MKDNEKKIVVTRIEDTQDEKKLLEAYQQEVTEWQKRKRAKVQGLRRNLIREHFPEVIMKNS